MHQSRARETTEAIERLSISMKHLFYRGFFKPSGVSGESLRDLLLVIQPEIYGSMTNPRKVELDGLLYVLDRLPESIEECSFIHLTSDEGFNQGGFQTIVPKKRRRNCYRIDQHQMNIEVLLGRSEIYDVLTHLTFLYLEADKIALVAYNNENKPHRIWEFIEEVALGEKLFSREEKEVALIHLSSVLGRTFEETLEAYRSFGNDQNPDRLFKIIYYLGKLSFEDKIKLREREIYFSAILKERVGHHFFGEKWAKNIKKILEENQWVQRPLHIISANMHSVKNQLFAHKALKENTNHPLDYSIYSKISNDTILQEKVSAFAKDNGMLYVKDDSGSNIDVQIFDLENLDLKNTPFANSSFKGDDLLLVFDYAFGEQAYEIMDELLKPYANKKNRMNVKSISIMGKAGILTGKKGDIMIPSSHIFEGTADNYAFENALSLEDFEDDEIKSCQGSMITVLGTSLQNKDILSYFMNTSWQAIGLEMEGAHYQKAIQVASKIRHHISEDLMLCYAYYASDNPLETGSTLSSGGLGLTGVKPTYMITQKIIEKILN